MKEPDVRSLLSIKNKAVRNILRGILAAEKPSVSRQAMRKLKNQASSSDLELAFQFLISNPTARHVHLAPIFPSSIEDSTSAPYLGDNRLDAELAVQKARFASSEQELLRAVSSIEQINKAVFERDGVQVSELIQTHTNDFGLSLFMMRKALSLRHTDFGQNPELNLRSAIDPFLARRRHLIAVAFEDSLDEQLSYIRVRRTFLSHIKNGRISREMCPVLQDFMSPLSWPVEKSPCPLEAYSRWGVLDSLEFLERYLNEKSSRFDGNFAAKIRDAIPLSVHEKWVEAFSNFGIKDVVGLLEGEQVFGEYRLFRHSLAWSEIQSVLDYRHQIETDFGHRLNGQPRSRETEPTLIDNSISEASELLSTEQVSELPLLPINTQTCGTFHRSLALAGTLDANESKIDVANGQELLSLLDQTMDVSLLLSGAELSKFLPRRSTDRLYEYLRTALQYDAEESRVTDHAFRRATQDIVGQEYGGDIVEYARYLDGVASSVAEHFFATCNEYFLTELYLLFEDSNAVIDAQANLLEWYGKTREDEDAELRAKSHRLNLRLRKVRGSIDDTRIYVDQLKFQYWAMDTITSQLRAFASSSDVLTIAEDGLPNLNDLIAAVEDPRTKLFQILDLAYREFCTNEFYGVDSYIGRRIRHGTLHGVLVAELKDPVDAIVEQFASTAPEFSSFVEHWHSRVESVVKSYGLELLRVRSNERKLGLIVPTIGDSDKRSIALNMLNTIASVLANDRNAGAAISYIYDFCWLLLEVDLKRLRAAALSAQQELVIRSNQHISGSSSELDAQILDASRYLNTELQQRFEHLVGWLTRPSNVSPSATLSLLFQAVILEVQGRHQGFLPKCVEVGEVGIDMFGHRFHTFYDILFILVDNAAKDGDREGELHFEVRSNNVSPVISEITMTITSSLKAGDEKTSCEAIIAAMNSDIGSAMLEDRNSGLRKIRVLVEKIDELSNFEVTFGKSTVSFSVVMSLAMTGADHQNENAK